jgi:hypothetical protein
VRDPVRPQLKPFVQIRHTEKVRDFAQGIGDFDHSVAVTVSFHDREQLCPRADPLPRNVSVMAQRRQIHFRPATICG